MVRYGHLAEDRLADIRQYIRNVLSSVAADSFRVAGDKNLPLAQTADGKLMASVQ